MAEQGLTDANVLVATKLNSYIEALEDKLSAHILTFSGQIYHNADLFIRDAIEQRKQKKPKKSKLVFSWKPVVAILKLFNE